MEVWLQSKLVKPERYIQRFDVDIGWSNIYIYWITIWYYEIKVFKCAETFLISHLGFFFISPALTFTYWTQHYRGQIIVLTFWAASFIDVWERRNQFIVTGVEADDHIGRSRTMSCTGALCVDKLYSWKLKGTCCHLCHANTWPRVSNKAFLIKHCN